MWQGFQRKKQASAFVESYKETSQEVSGWDEYYY